MFLSEMSEAKQELIEIKDFDGDAIQDLVHFAYSSKLTLTVDNVQPLLYAACILQVKKHKYKQSTNHVGRFCIFDKRLNVVMLKPSFSNSKC